MERAGVNGRRQTETREGAAGGGSEPEEERNASTIGEGASARSAEGAASASTIGEGASARRAKQTRTSPCRRVSRSSDARQRFLLPLPVPFTLRLDCEFIVVPRASHAQIARVGLYMRRPSLMVSDHLNGSLIKPQIHTSQHSPYIPHSRHAIHGRPLRPLQRSEAVTVLYIHRSIAHTYLTRVTHILPTSLPPST